MINKKNIKNRRFKTTAFTVGSFLLIIFIIHLLNFSMDMALTNFGLEPRTFTGLLGIITMPLLHGDWMHLIGNSMSFLVLAGMLFYFYPKLSYRIFFISWIAIGVLVWFTGRPSVHIGASGIIYAFAAFLFLSGLIRRYYKLMAVSLIVVFLYGSMLWGVLPGQPGISWESHLSGMLVGLLLAVIFRKQGPQKPKPSWEETEEAEEEKEIVFFQTKAYFHSSNSLESDLSIHYSTKPKEKKKTKQHKTEIQEKDNKNTGFRFKPMVNKRKP